MPIYEYRCLECGKTFESIQKFNDEAYKECGQSSVECPGSGHGKVERLLGSPALQFKGSGFYITDYTKSGGTSGGNQESSSSSAKPETKSDSSSSTKKDS